jgi:hypothetical protein
LAALLLEPWLELRESAAPVLDIHTCSSELIRRQRPITRLAWLALGIIGVGLAGQAAFLGGYTVRRLYRAGRGRDSASR